MLILNPGLMVNMDDGHLLRSLECEAAIMRTPVELELMGRLERLADEVEDARGLVEVADEFSASAADFRAVAEAHPAGWSDCAKLLGMLNDAGIEDADDLAALIALKPKED